MIPPHLHFALFITFLTLFLKLLDLEERWSVARTKRRVVLDRWDPGIAGSNPGRGMAMSYVSRSLGMDCLPVQGVL
jgi:hypothetical protein